MEKTTIIVIPRPRMRCSCDNVCKTLLLLGFRDTSNRHWIYWIKDSVEFAFSVVLDPSSALWCSISGSKHLQAEANKWAWVVSKFSRVLTGWHRESIAGLASQAFNHMVYSLQSKAKWDGCSLYTWTWIEIWGQMEMKYDEMRFVAKQYSPFDSPCTSLRVCMCIESASMYCFVWMAASENPMWIPGSFALWRPLKAYNATSPILRHRMETAKAVWPWNVDSVSRYSGRTVLAGIAAAAAVTLVFSWY